MQDTVTLAHGAGGKQTSELIEKVFKAHFSNPYFTPDDAAVLQIPAGKMAMSTDGFIVSPAFSPAEISASSQSAERSTIWPAWAHSPCI
jgi:hydrogenase expression/formation protein HypE